MKTVRGQCSVGRHVLKPFEEGWFCDKHRIVINLEMWYTKNCTTCSYRVKMPYPTG